MSLKIITDSASDVRPDEYDNVIVLPMTISFDGVEYKDGIDIDQKVFFEKLIECENLPKTSQVNPADFEAAYEKIKENGDEAIVITMSSQLSGTNQSANIAAQEYADTISVIDSETVTIGEHILIKKMRSMIEQGLTRAQIVDEINTLKKKITLIALLDTLEYLRRGGRVSNIAGFVGEALAIKPVIAIADGVVKVLGKARGSKNGNNLLNKQIEACNGIDYESPVFVAYSGLSDALLNKYLEDNKELWENKAKDLTNCCIGGTIGTHAGPGAIAVCFLEK